MAVIINQWLLHEITTIEDFIRLMNDNLLSEQREEFNGGCEHLRSEFTDLEMNDKETIFEFNFDGVKSRYILFEGSTERKKNIDNWVSTDGTIRNRDDRIRLIKKEFMVCELDGKLVMISFGGKDDVEKIISDLFNQSVWGKIEHLGFNVDEDLFYWLLKRARDYNSKPLSSKNNRLILQGLSGMIGQTNESNVKARGQRVIALLGTIAYIFSTDKLKSLTPEFLYNDQVIVVELILDIKQSKPTNIKIHVDDCHLFNFNGLNSSHKRFHVALISLTMIPVLLDCYEHERVTGGWNQAFKIDFLEALGNEIVDRVNEEKEALKSYSKAYSDDE